MSELKKVETEISRTLPVNETCSVETNLRCSYKWLDKERNTAVYSDVLKLDAGDCSKTGRYECSGECIIRGRVCLIEPLKVHLMQCESGKKIFFCSVHFFIVVFLKFNSFIFIV